MRTPFIAANWKMYKTIGEAVDFAREFVPLVADTPGVDKVIAPPFTALKALSDTLKGTDIMTSSQNIYFEREGAFTGEVSPGMAKDAGAAFTIVGHSERRQYFGETDEIVNKKIGAGLDAGLGIIFCCGESLDERQTGRTFDVLKRQVAHGLTGMSLEDFSRIVIAYEPIWAIGTGLTATPEQAQEAHFFIRAELRELHGPEAAEMRILYGGSVKPENIDSLMSQPDLDGALVGGASLNAQSFAKIVKFKRG
jgi:triosephosphate isomerase